MNTPTLNRISTALLVIAGLTAVGIGGLPLYIGGGATLLLGLLRAGLE